MLFKAIVLEALVAAAAVNAQETSITPVEVAVNAKHTPLSQCPGRSKVYVALSKYSAPASFCSTFMSLNGGTQTITKTQSNAAPVTTTTTDTTTNLITITQTSTTTITTTTTSGVLPQCTSGGPVRRDVSANTDAKASASTSTKAQIPKQLKGFRTKALSSACSCMGYTKDGSGTIVTITESASSASAAIKTKEITQKATTTFVTTVTSTTTATVTYQIAGAGGAIFAIMAADSGTSYDGTYLALTDESITRAAFSASDIANASDFQIDSSNDLVEYNNQTSAISYANQDEGNPCEPVYFDGTLYDGEITLTCCVDGSSNLQCGNTNGASEFSVGTQNGLLYFCQSNKTADFGGLSPVNMSVQLL